jgi:diguanylate cyclase (GGDEF)-like protein
MLAVMREIRRFNITTWLGRRSRSAHVGLTLASFLGVVAVLHFAPTDVHTAALFLVPISFAAWFLSPGSGWLGAFLAGVVLFVYENRRHPGEPGVIFLNAFLNIGMYSFFAFVISEIRGLYEREQDLSLHDPLTGLLNLRAFTGVLTLESRRLARHHSPLTLTYVDIDDFKSINDTLGHSAGDVFLQDLAVTLKNTVRATDYVARLGGDEFTILLPETGGPAAQLAIAKIFENVAALMQDHRPAVSVSIGVVTFEGPASSPAEMIRMADEAMYEVKRTGKNRIVYKIFQSDILLTVPVRPLERHESASIEPSGQTSLPTQVTG